MRQAKNPILPCNEYIPDPEAHVFEDRLYIFGSHDRFNGEGYCLEDYVGYSAPVDDLSNWKYEGVIYKREQHPDKSLKGRLYAPDVAKGPDGRYYLYYSISDSNTISVAVSNTPAGEYEYYGEVHYFDGRVAGSDPKDYFEFDPAVFVDEDGKIYLYSGSGQKENKKAGYPVVGVFVRELDKDMITALTEPKILMSYDDNRSKPNFFEGASMRRFKDKYYLVYFGTDFTGLHYCTSKYPDRDFEYGGLIHSTADIGYQGRTKEDPVSFVNNNHGSLEEVNGQVFIFNHRHTNRSPFSRQAVAEPIILKEDGSIETVESTSTGLNNGPFTEKGEYLAYIACNFFSKKINGKRDPLNAPYPTEKGEGKQYVTDIRDGSKIGIKYFQVPDVSSIDITLRGRAEGQLLISTAEEEEILCALSVKVDTKKWHILHGELNFPEGKKPLFFTFVGTGTIDMLSFELK